MISFEVKPSKSSSGVNGTAVFELLGGEYGADSAKNKKGRRIFHNFLIEHSNSKAVEFSNNKLNKLLAATGNASTIQDLGFDYAQVMELAGDSKLVIGLETNEYVDKEGNVVTGNRITAFKKN